MSGKIFSAGKKYPQQSLYLSGKCKTARLGGRIFDAADSERSSKNHEKDNIWN